MSGPELGADQVLTNDDLRTLCFLQGPGQCHLLHGILSPSLVKNHLLLTVCSYHVLFEMITHLVFFVTQWAEGQRQIRFNLCVPGLWVTVSVH